MIFLRNTIKVLILGCFNIGFLANYRQKMPNTLDKTPKMCYTTLFFKIKHYYLQVPEWYPGNFWRTK